VKLKNILLWALYLWYLTTLGLLVLNITAQASMMNVFMYSLIAPIFVVLAIIPMKNALKRLKGGE
jgi:succinate-acetate transporter protein